MADGGAAAFEQLMRDHNRLLFRTARAILRDDAEAEDALQEAYLRAYRAIGGFRGESKVSTWLVRIVVNEALARRRKLARRAEILPLRSGDLEESEHEEATEMSKQERPERAAGRAQMRRLLETKIDALPEAHRIVFMLRAVEEMSVEETAAALELPQATVRTRFFRARGLLRESLARDVDRSLEDAFGFAGERCDRIVAGVLEKIKAGT